VYTRLVLLCDGEEGELAEASLQLTSAGLSVLYSNDPDETVLLAREYAEQIGALLICARTASERLPKLTKHVVEPLGLRAAAVLPVGEKLADKEILSLKEQGLCFALWSPYQPAELAFAVRLLLHTLAIEERRTQIRVPLGRPARVADAGGEQPCVVRDVSVGGVFAAMPKPLPQGAELSLSFRLPSGEITARGIVAWNTDERGPHQGHLGMGISFAALPPDVQQCITRFVEYRAEQFKL
jgi:hypothetical protein